MDDEASELVSLLWSTPFQFSVVLSAQSDGAARSPAVFAAMISYIRDVLDVFGIDLLNSKVRTSETFLTFFFFRFSTGNRTVYMGLKTTFLQHVLTPAVLACAGGWRGESRWQPGGCGGAADSFQKRSSSVRPRSPRRSNQWIHQQTWTLQRKNPSPQSLWHPQRWPDTVWCVDKGKAHIEIKTVILTV